MRGDALPFSHARSSVPHSVPPCARAELILLLAFTRIDGRPGLLVRMRSPCVIADLIDRPCAPHRIEKVKKCESLQEDELKALCEFVKEILVEESNVQPVNAPVTASAPHE